MWMRALLFFLKKKQQNYTLPFFSFEDNPCDAQQIERKADGDLSTIEKLPIYPKGEFLKG